MKRMHLLSGLLLVAACGNKEHGAAPASNEPKEPAPAPLVKGADKGDCKTAYAPKLTRDPNAMCKVAGGSFVMGDGSKVTLSPYFIDQFEVTNSQILHYLRATHAESGCKGAAGAVQDSCFLVSNSSPIQKKQDGTYELDAHLAHRPFVLASLDGAEQYCAWAGKTLPTESQWEFAARHDPLTGRDWTYPWGDAFDGTRAHCAIGDCPGGPAHEEVDVGTYDGTGGHGDGRSPWGVFEMAGNAAELVAGCGVDTPVCKEGCVDPAPLAQTALQPGEICEKVVRGGGVEGKSRLQSAQKNTAPYGGFRCARRGP